jgi:hypothetical protein
MAGKPTEETGMALDQWQEQAARIRQGHLDAIGALAASAAEYAGYVGREAGNGRLRFGGDLLGLAQRIASHSAAIEVIDQIVTIAQTPDAT